MKKLLLVLFAVIIGYVLAGALVDRVVFPEPEPGEEFYPKQGHVFESRSEGFRQKISKREGGLLWLELEIMPHAPGPPEHIHTTFAENFIVAEGTLSLMVNGEKKTVRAGESLLVEPGTPHRPFNETDSRVLIAGPALPEYAIPDRFGVFLTQAYGFFDESEANSRMPTAMLQMSRFGPKYDVWLAGPPVMLQKVMFFVIGPSARLLGYRSYYEKYKPRAEG